MDLMKTLLVYMMLVVGAATETAPAVTPPPTQPAPTAFSFITAPPPICRRTSPRNAMISTSAARAA